MNPGQTINRWDETDLSHTLPGLSVAVTTLSVSCYVLSYCVPGWDCCDEISQVQSVLFYSFLWSESGVYLNMTGWQVFSDKTATLL